MRHQIAYRRHLPHFQRADKTYLVTFATRNRRVLSEASRDLVLAEIVRQHEQTALLHTAVVMPDHVHMVLTPTIPLASIARLIKGRTARQINLSLGRRGTVWQEEPHDHQLRSADSLAQKCEYVALNPVRAGLARDPEEYRWLWRRWVDLPG